MKSTTLARFAGATTTTVFAMAAAAVLAAGPAAAAAASLGVDTNGDGKADTYVNVNANVPLICQVAKTGLSTEAVAKLLGISIGVKGTVVSCKQ